MNEPTRYFDRYAREMRTEQIYGERWLRWAYGNPAGRFAVWLLIRRALFSKWYGWKMGKRTSDLRILPFISKYNIDVDEFVKSPFDFKTFNEFFYRALKPSARPIAAGERVAVFPADGRHLVFPDVDSADGFYVKGERFALDELSGTGFQPVQCSMLISRLCPTDCHRFIFPVDGTPDEPRLTPGWLYSVHPIALKRNIRHLVQNKRMTTIIDSPAFGKVAMIEIGATNVGSIVQSFVPGRPAAKGTEKGFFAFGGSCIVTIFQRGRIVFDRDLVEQSARHVETFSKMGDRLGSAGSP